MADDTVYARSAAAATDSTRKEEGMICCGEDGDVAGGGGWRMVKEKEKSLCVREGKSKRDS